jgi:hypothetical protein
MLINGFFLVLIKKNRINSKNTINAYVIAPYAYINTLINISIIFLYIIIVSQ